MPSPPSVWDVGDGCASTLLDFLKHCGKERNPTMNRISCVFLALAAFAYPVRHAFAGTIGHWRFEEGTAGNTASAANSILDSSVELNHGTPTGGPTYSALTPFSTVAQTGQANGLSLNFDGANDVVTIAHTPALGSVGPFTVEFWMRSEGTGSGQDLLVDKSHGFGDSTGWAFQSQPGSGFIFFLVGVDGPNLENFFGVLSLSNLFDNQWHHLAGTYDGNTAEFFVDGVSQGTNAVGTYLGNTRDIHIGNTWQFSRYFAGQIDELRISDTVLTQSELLNSAPETYCSVVFSTDFDADFPDEISGIATTEPVQGFSEHGFSGTFLRNLTSGPPEKTVLTLSDLPDHDFISIGFLLAIIDTWDGPNSAPAGGEDLFNVTLDGDLIFSECPWRGSKLRRPAGGAARGKNATGISRFT